MYKHANSKKKALSLLKASARSPAHRDRSRACMAKHSCTFLGGIIAAQRSSPYWNLGSCLVSCLKDSSMVPFWFLDIRRPQTIFRRKGDAPVRSGHFVLEGPFVG